MIFKNITKKKICILHGGQKIIVNPGEFIEGEKSVFECYRGLIKIINPKITPRVRDYNEIQVDFIIVEDMSN